MKGECPHQVWGKFLAPLAGPIFLLGMLGIARLGHPRVSPPRAVQHSEMPECPPVSGDVLQRD